MRWKIKEEEEKKCRSTKMGLCEKGVRAGNDVSL